MNIKFKKLNKNAVIPKRSTDGAIGYDLFIPMDMQVYQGRNILPLNFALEMPKGVEAKIEPRSGFASKGMEGKSLPDLDGHQYTARYNADVLVGKIDPDYRGNIGVIINNHDQSFIFPKGTKVAQMTFYKVELPTIEEVDNLSDTERGEDGFGSTGTNENTPQEEWLNSHDEITEADFADINDMFGILLRKNGEDVILHELTQGIYEQPNEAIRDLFWEKVGGIINIIEGSIILDGNSQLTLPNLTSVGREVVARGNSQLTLPNLTSVGHDVVTAGNSQLTLPNLTSVGQNVVTNDNCQLTLPNLTSVGQNVVTNDNCQLTLPNLTSISGSVITFGNSQLTMPNVTSVDGNVVTFENSQLTLPNLASVGGSVVTYNDSQLTLPNVTSIGGYVKTNGNSQLTLPSSMRGKYEGNITWVDKFEEPKNMG